MVPTLRKADSSAAHAEDCSGLISRILASQAFSRSERLSSFLRYICELTLKGRADEINEQRIGEAVFGRPPGYDSMIDGIVRTQATRLRQRLDYYFRTEGTGESLRVLVPRGGYVPVFEEHLSAQVPGPSPVELPIPDQNSPRLGSPTEPRRRRIFPAAFWTAVLVALIAVAVSFLRVRSIPHAQASALHPFWSQIFNNRLPTLVVPGDSSLVIWEGLKNRNMDLGDYLSGAYRAVAPEDESGTAVEAAELASRRYTSIVDLEIVQALTLIAPTQGGSIRIRYARDVRPNDLKPGNAVLIGDTEANPWVSLFEQNMNFVFSYDRATDVLSVDNRNPRGNEPRQWDFGVSDPEHRVYAVVAYVSNLSRDGNVLILEGTSMAGTECAWDFVSDDSQLIPFLRRIRHADGTIPHFELVLGSQNEGGSAGRAKILAWRIDH